MFAPEFKVLKACITFFLTKRQILISILIQQVDKSVNAYTWVKTLATTFSNIQWHENERTETPPR